MKFAATWKQVILNSNHFFQNMSTPEEYTPPFIFAGINFIILDIMIALEFSWFFFLLSPLAGLSSFFLIPIIGIIIQFLVLLLTSVILYGAYKFLEGNGNFKETLKMLSYAWAPIVFAGVPVIGWFISLYAIYLNIIGGMTVHNISLKKSIVACVLCYIGIFVFILIIGGIISALISLSIPRY
jgi:hypothetical protein